MRAPWLNKSHLWLVTDRQACSPRTVVQVLDEVVPGGIDVVVIRDKEAAYTKRKVLAVEVSFQCGQLGIPFVVAHDVDLAIELKSAGIHLGVGDVSIEETRARVGDRMAIGYSSHSVEEAGQAFQLGADYVFLGPIFASPKKLKYGNPLGVEVIGPALDLPGPVIFIGGMDNVSIPKAMQHGATSVAAIRAVQSGENPSLQVKLITQMINRREV